MLTSSARLRTDVRDLTAITCIPYFTYTLGIVTNSSARTGVHASRLSLAMLLVVLDVHRVLTILASISGNTRTFTVLADTSMRARGILALHGLLASISCKSTITYARSRSFVAITDIAAAVRTGLLHNTITLRTTESQVTEALTLSTNTMNTTIIWTDLTRLGELGTVLTTESCQALTFTTHANSTSATILRTSLAQRLTIHTRPRSETLTFAQ